MKRRSVIFIFLILSCFLLLACAKKEEVTPEKEESTPEEVAEKDYEEYTELWKMNQNSEVQFEDIPKEIEGYTAKYYRSGNGGLCNVAEWDDGKHFYALIINPGTDRGFEDKVIVKLIKSIR